MCICACVLLLILIWFFSIACYFYALQLQMHVRLICAIKFYLLTYLLTWPTSVCRRRLRMVVASLALQSPGPSWCSPGFGSLLASAALLRTWNRLSAALQSPELSLASFKRHSRPTCSSTKQCSYGVSCAIVRRCCDCTACSTPITNVQTRLDSNWLSTNRPSFAVANQVVTLTRVTNERAV